MIILLLWWAYYLFIISMRSLLVSIYCDCRVMKSFKMFDIFTPILKRCYDCIRAHHLHNSLIVVSSLYNILDILSVYTNLKGWRFLKYVISRNNNVYRCERFLVREDVICLANTIINGYHKWKAAYNCCQALCLVKT